MFSAKAMSRRTLLFCAVPIILATAINARAQDLDELLSISLTDLMEMDVSVASGIPESILEAPAAIVVITAEDIRQRGYTSLAEVVVDLPGFDTVLGQRHSISLRLSARLPAPVYAAHAAADRRPGR